MFQKYGSNSDFNAFSVDIKPDLEHHIAEFPPKMLTVLHPINIKEIVLIRSEHVQSGKLKSDEIDASIDFYEATLLSIYSRAVENREKEIIHSKDVSEIPPFIHDENDEILDNLVQQSATLNDEVVKLLSEINTLMKKSLFKLEDIMDEVMDEAAIESCVNYKKRLTLLRTTGQALRNELMQSSIFISASTERLEYLMAAEDVTCPLDTIQPNWEAIDAVRQTEYQTARSKNFRTFMNARCLSISDRVYAFLQSTKAQANILDVSDYTFAAGELQGVFDFFIYNSSSVSSATPGDTARLLYRTSVYDRTLMPGTNRLSDTLQHLSITSCDLADRDCHTIALCIPAFCELKSLSLRNNKITTSGATSLAVTMWDSSLSLRSLKLDHNEIGPDGAVAIARAITRCRLLSLLSLSYNPIGDRGLYYIVKKIMNKFRKAVLSIPKPPEESSPLGLGEYSSSDEVEDEEGEGEEDDVERGETADGLTQPGSSVLKSSRGDGSIAARFGALNTQFADLELQGKEDDDEFSMSDTSIYSESMASVAPTVNTVNEVGQSPFAQMQQRKHKSKWAAAISSIRYKLIAVSVFMRFMERGHRLAILNVAGCTLSSYSAGAVAHAALDNPHLVHIDLSDNDLGDLGAKHLARLLVGGSVQSLKVRGCGLTDIGIQSLSQAAARSVELQTLDISDNLAGPTGINWVGAASNVYSVDHISIGSGYHSSAPMPRKGGHSDVHSDVWEGTDGTDSDILDYLGGAYRDEDDDEVEEEEEEEDFSRGAHERK